VAVDHKRENTQTYLLLRVPESMVKQFNEDGRNVALIEGEDGVDLSKVESNWGYGTRCQLHQHFVRAFLVQVLCSFSLVFSSFVIFW